MSRTNGPRYKDSCGSVLVVDEENVQVVSSEEVPPPTLTEITTSTPEPLVVVEPAVARRTRGGDPDGDYQRTISTSNERVHVNNNPTDSTTPFVLANHVEFINDEEVHNQGEGGSQGSISVMSESEERLLRRVQELELQNKHLAESRKTHAAADPPECSTERAQEVPTPAVVADTTNTSPSLPQDPYTLAFQQIDFCESVQDFVLMYNADVYQTALNSLTAAVGPHDTEEWAKGWAIRMRSNKPEDVKLNKDRKLCLQLLFSLCDRWTGVEKKNIPATVSTDDLVYTFKAERILNILNVALAMDRAQALYKMKNIGSGKFGMHWVAEQHLDRSPIWDALLGESQRPTMNKRFHYLLELDALGLRHVTMIAKWLEPRVIPQGEGDRRLDL